MAQTVNVFTCIQTSGSWKSLVPKPFPLKKLTWTQFIYVQPNIHHKKKIIIRSVEFRTNFVYIVQNSSIYQHNIKI